jgi:hypothetical protein
MDKAWKVCAPSLCKFFLWLMLQNHIWIVDRLLMRGGGANQYFVHFATETWRQLFIFTISNWTTLSDLYPQHWIPSREVTGWFNELTSSSSSPKSEGARSLTILVSEMHEFLKGKRRMCLIQF